MQANEIVSVFNAIDGNYEATVLQGVWHAFCDSGIMTDAFSVNDSERINAAGLYKEDEDGMCFAYENGLEDINAAVKAFDNGDDLDCVKCVNAIIALGYDVEEFFDEYSAFE